MKKRFVFIIFFILVISISFISANPFTDFFKKLTGQSIEQAKTPIQRQINEIKSITPESVPTTSNVIKCSDSDGKSNFLESGYVNFNSKTYYDYCDNNLAYDYYCSSSSNIVANVIKIIGNAITEQTTPDKTSKDCTSYGLNYACSEGKCIKVGDCLNGETKPCGVDLGQCKPGVQVCVNLYWTECQNQILPSEEICDSMDNDCDGTIDEGVCINQTIANQTQQTNQTQPETPIHKTCLGNSCISINGNGTDECYSDDQCIVNEATPIEKPNFFAGILGIASETPETQEEINPVYSNKPITKTTYIYAGNLVASKSTDKTETTYYIQDHLGSNRKVVDGEFIEQENEFYAFGETKETTGDSENDYLYTGKELDETGLYYYGARYYNPELGRFTQPDSLTGNLQDPLSMNWYSYVQNNPLKYVDPTGNEEQTPAGNSNPKDTVTTTNWGPFHITLPKSINTKDTITVDTNNEPSVFARFFTTVGKFIESIYSDATYSPEESMNSHQQEEEKLNLKVKPEDTVIIHTWGPFFTTDTVNKEGYLRELEEKKAEQAEEKTKDKHKEGKDNIHNKFHVIPGPGITPETSEKNKRESLEKKKIQETSIEFEKWLDEQKNIDNP